jgi:M6 family metalloprotease-like protein
MKRIFIALMFCLSLQMNAQYDAFDAGSTTGIRFHRQPCVHHDDAPTTRTASTQEEACLRATGSPKILVCLANFTDVKFTVAPDDEALVLLFDKFFNAKNVGTGDNPYSVCDYFCAMSDGIFTPEFVIMEPITLSKNRSYYGQLSGDSRRNVFRKEAIDSLSSKISDRVDEFDTDNDGMIDGVIVIFPGAGANVGDKNGMHPACWTSAYTTTKCAVTYATSLIAPEMLGLDYTSQGGPNNAKLNAIGIFVHEMSHMLGLPDFYDLNYSAPGMDYWSLMDYGEYWQNGYYPTPYTAYERHFMGWLSLVELSEPTYVTSMKAIADGGSAYVIYNDGNRDEYYILENRTTADPYSYNLCNTLGSGLMIYHVDYNSILWKNNRINTDPNRQRMTIIPANGYFDIADNFTDSNKYLSELRGHLWPLKDIPSVVEYYGIVGNNSLTDEERSQGLRLAPAATLYNPNIDGSFLMHKPITDIVYDATTRTISFSFMGGEPTGIGEVPENLNHSIGNSVYTVYSLDGRIVTICGPSALDSLPRGLYILRNTATGETTKRLLGK